MSSKSLLGIAALVAGFVLFISSAPDGIRPAFAGITSAACPFADSETATECVISAAWTQGAGGVAANQFSGGGPFNFTKTLHITGAGSITTNVNLTLNVTGAGNDVIIDGNGFIRGNDVTTTNGSDITITAADVFSISGDGFIETLNASSNGNGGAVSITANGDHVELLDSGRISTARTGSGSTAGSGGPITINVPTGYLSMSGSSLIDSEMRATAGNDGGAINITVGEYMEMLGSATITSSKDGGTSGGIGAGNITIDINGGDLTMSGTAAILAETTPGARGNGGDIDIGISGDLSMTDSAKISSSRTSTTGTGSGGDIDIEVGPHSVNGDCTAATGDFLLDTAASILANSGTSSAGAISIHVCRQTDIKGLVESRSLQSGVGAGAVFGGGPIDITTGCTLTVSGKVSSRSQDPIGSLVHLEGCDVVISGLVESTGVSHGSGTNNCTPTAATCIEVIAHGSLTITNTGEINADTGGSGGSSGTSWIHLLAQGNIDIQGDASGWSVHADGNSTSNDNGGLVTITSLTGKVIASGQAVSASAPSNGGDGGEINIEAGGAGSAGDVALGTSTIRATGFGNNDEGGSIFARSYHGRVTGSAPGLLDAQSLTPTTPGSVTLQGCGTAALLDGVAYTGTTDPSPFTQPADNCDENLTGELSPCACQPEEPEEECPICEKDEQGNIVTVIVDNNVVVDFNPAIPICDDNPNLPGAQTDDLCKFVASYDKTGPDVSQWKVVFDLKGKKLVIEPGAIVTTTAVPNSSNNRQAPGIEIVGTCEIVIGEGGGVVVTSVNQPAGDILLKFDGPITIDGIVRNEVTGTNGKPGEITIASCCGDIVTGPKSRIETLGVDPGGADINILACCGGNIHIQGLVFAYHKQVSQGGKTPTINVVAFEGTVTIDGNNVFGEETIAGTKYLRTSGLLVQVSGATVAGDINIQAEGDVTVIGNRILNKNRLQFGAVAIKSHNTNGQGGDGDMTVQSTAGKILASDRAFDFENRFNALNAITLEAAGNIELRVLLAPNDGALNGSKGVVSSQGGVAGKGGSNSLRSFAGGIIIGSNAQVLANATGGGANGVNLLESCAGVTDTIPTGIIPADLIAGDDIGSCIPLQPAPNFADCAAFGIPFVHSEED